MKHHGLIKTTGKGMGFVTVDGMEQEVVITPEFLNHALNGDTVEIILTGTYVDTKRAKLRTGTDSEFKAPQQAGQVVKIIERHKDEYVGTLLTQEGKYQVVPDDRRMYVNIAIPADKINGATPNQKVLAQITGWENGQTNPQGEIVQVIGDKGTHETEMQSIILDRGIDTNFPDDVDAEAHALEKSEKPIKPEEIARRKDFRGTFTTTIDPFDAKDFDDALSIKDLGDGKFEIGVHIADVSHYVRPGTALDREAKNRGTSVYLVDRTIPMLPEVLSNDLCSLNPHEDKCAFSAVFVMDMEGKVHERWFGKTVINSDKRFSYEEAQESLNTQGLHFKELNTLNQIAYKLRAEKYKAGAIDFETEEVKFKLDKDGKPIEVVKKQRLDTHKLVEEYMLLANREVAKFIYDKQKGNLDTASIYRIHDLPDPDRMADLSLFLQAMGHSLPLKQGKVNSQDINKLLKSIVGTPEESLIKTATIRSMAKAIYSTKNIGHFGLAFTYYTHFTSPIRRYPDLIVQRILYYILNQDKKHLKDEWKSYEKIANHSTEKEIAAAEAERASIKYKQVEYMSAHIGEEFNGKISGVTEWGLYVEEENTKCEGMIPLRELGNDFFTLNRKTYTVIGEKTKKKFRLGDAVRFRVVNADLDAKTLDYKLVA
ncbi:MAG: ribonuclease R [Patescibacteria group bacterium]